MITFHRIRSAEEALFAQSWALYTVSFPLHERRQREGQEALLCHPQYHFDVILADGVFAGILLYWTLSGCTYIEHFAIDEQIRGQALGTRSLTAFTQSHSLVILEIDPPVDQVSVRREGFYQRLGFHASECEHTHPAYRAEFPPHELVLMSYPRVLSAGDVAAFQRELREIVMADVVLT